MLLYLLSNWIHHPRIQTSDPNIENQIATLGPASCTKDQIEALFLAGVDVFRLNFSHGAHEEKAKVCCVLCVVVCCVCVFSLIR